MKIMLYLLVTFLLFFGALPSLISTHLGTRLTCYILEKWMGGSLSVKELSIGWFDMQKVEGLDYTNTAIDLSIERLTSHNSLFEIFFKGGDLGKALIYSPSLNIKNRTQKKTHLSILPRAGDLYLENGQLITPELKVSHVNCEAGIPPNRSLIALKASGLVNDGRLSGSFDIQGTLYPDRCANSSLQARIKDLPLKDILTLMCPDDKDLLLAAFGESLNLNLNAGYITDQARINLSFKTPLMEGNIHLNCQAGSLTLAEKSTLTWQVKDALYPYFHLPFQNEVLLHLNIDAFYMPFDSKALHWEMIQGSGSLSALPFNITFNTTTLKDSLLLELTSQPLSGKAILTHLSTPIFLELHAKKFPLSILNRSKEVVPLLGRLGDFDLLFQQNELSFNADSEHLHIPPTIMTYQSDNFHLKAPVTTTFKESSGTLQEFSGSLHNFKALFTDIQWKGGQLNTLNLAMRGDTLALEGTDNTGSFKGTYQLSSQKGLFSLDRLSTYNLGSVFGYERDLPSLIGPTLSGKVIQTGDRFDLSLRASELSLQGTLYYKEGIPIKGGPLNLEWILSEQSYHALSRLLKKESHQLIKIQKPSTLKVQVASFDGDAFKGTFESSDLYLAPNHQLSQLKGKIDKGSSTEFDLSGSIKPSGYIKLHGIIDKTTELTGEIKNLPTIFLDALPLKMRLSQLLGANLSVNMKGHLADEKGRFNLTIDASNFKTDVLAVLEKGTLSLERSIDIGLQITPELGKLFLGDASIDVVSAKNPLLIHIDRRGLAIPYESFQIQKVRLPFISIDLGQISVRSSGNAAEVSKIFKLQRDPKEPLSLYFAPMILHVNQGIATLERTEILYDGRFDLCTWGEIDLMKEYVNLKLGFTAQALHLGFGLKMPPSYVLVIPMKGPYDNVKVDTQIATTKIAGIIAQKAGAAVGGIWGGVLGAVGSMTDDQSKVPPPKRPFPWEKEASLLDREVAPVKHKKSFKRL